MNRLQRALGHTTAYSATFASLLALVACSSDGGEDVVPPFQSSPVPGATTPIDPGNGAPVNMDGTTPVTPGNPSGDMSTDVPLAPGDQGDGQGDGNGQVPPGEEQPPPGEEQPPPGEEQPPPGEEQPPPGEEQPQPEPGTFVENSGVGCTVPQLPAANTLTAINGLPDPFTKLDGTRMTTRAEWRCRRAEIKELAEQYIYGDKPARPESVTGSVSGTNITVNVRNGNASTSFSARIQLPNGASGPVPALFTVGGFSQSNVVQSEGVAIIDFQPFDVGDEGGSRANKQGAFYDIYGANSFTGLLAAWSWGVSRMIDVIEESGGNVIRADALAVAGCSRFGKGAFTIGAFDERIALTIPFESGSGGVPIWRGIPGEGAQSLQSAFGETYWLGDNFGSFINDGQNNLPVDTHEIVAMVAPRGLLILDNPFIANLGPRSAHVAAQAGAQVFQALGAGANISYNSAVASGTHCSARPEHVEPLRQALRKFLLKTGNAAGSITTGGSAQGNLGQFVNYTVPTLN
ncbi:MAG: cellulose-binding protein [Polyangiaceae bacterium]